LPQTEPAFFGQGPFPVQVKTTENLEEKGETAADDIISKLHMIQVT